MTTTTGAVTLTATTSGRAPFTTSSISAAQLNDAAKDDGTVADWQGDAAIRAAILAAFATAGEPLPATDTVSSAAKFMATDGSQALRTGDRVRVKALLSSPRA